MLRQISVHRINETNVVDHLRRLRKNTAHPLSALAVLLKLERRFQQSAFGVSQGPKLDCFRTLPGVFFDGRFVVKGIDRRWTTGHEKLNDAFCLGPKMGQAISSARLLEEICKPQRAHSPSQQTEGRPAGLRLIQWLHLQNYSIRPAYSIRKVLEILSGRHIRALDFSPTEHAKK